MKKSLIVLVVGSLMLAIPAAAQVTVTTLAEGDDPVQETQQVRLSRFLDLTEIDHLAVGDQLSEFDQITSLSDQVRIELTCANGSVLEFGEGFRVMIGSTEEGDCAAIVTVAGQGDVLTEERTETNIGGTALITEGTRFAFRLRRDGQALRQEVLVFDGEVVVRKRGAAGTWSGGHRVGAGRVVDLAREKAGKPQTRRVQASEIQWWAKRYASFDVVKAREAGVSLDARQAAELQTKLTKQHEAVLENPEKVEARAELAATQRDNRVNREALYHTEKVQKIDPGALQRYPGLENLMRQRRDVLRPLNP